MQKAQIILWLGLLMVVLQIVKDWPVIKVTLFAPVTSGSSKGSSGSNAGSSFAGGGIAGATGVM